MPSFSQRSMRELATCDERLQRIARCAIQIIDFAVTEGHREKAAQEAAFTSGFTKVHWPNGAHNALPSRAIDIAPWPIDYSGGANLERFVFLQGIIHVCAVELGIKIRHGMDWDGDFDTRDERFRDYPHVELAEP